MGASLPLFTALLMIFSRAPLSFSVVRSAFNRLGFTRSSGIGASACALMLALATAGCATGDYAYVTTVATGERIHIPLERGTPVPARKGDITIAFAALVPTVSANKELGYFFGLEDKNPTPPKSIRVEDISDEHPVLMGEDLDPKLTNHRWSLKSRMFKGAEPEMLWIANVDNSMRVFRFTITAQDGTTTVLDQGWMVPGWAKAPMRQALGLK